MVQASQEQRAQRNPERRTARECRARELEFVAHGESGAKCRPSKNIITTGNTENTGTSSHLKFSVLPVFPVVKAFNGTVLYTRFFGYEMASAATRAHSASTAAPTKMLSSAALKRGECAGAGSPPGSRAPMRRKQPGIFSM